MIICSLVGISTFHASFTQQAWWAPRAPSSALPGKYLGTQSSSQRFVRLHAVHSGRRRALSPGNYGSCAHLQRNDILCNCNSQFVWRAPIFTHPQRTDAASPSLSPLRILQTPSPPHAESRVRPAGRNHCQRTPPIRNCRSRVPKDPLAIWLCYN